MNSHFGELEFESVPSFWDKSVENKPCSNIKKFISLETFKVQTLKVRSKFQCKPIVKSYGQKKGLVKLTI
jgi:hypothetical protein